MNRNSHLQSRRGAWTASRHHVEDGSTALPDRGEVGSCDAEKKIIKKRMDHLTAAMGVTLAASLGVAVSIPSPVAAVGISDAKGSHVASHVTCTQVKGTITGNITFKDCTPRSREKKATILTVSIWVGNGGTLTWNGGKTTVVSGTYTLGGNACAARDLQINVTGSVTGGTSTYTKKGDVVSGVGCVDLSTDVVDMAAGTSFKL